MIKKCDALRLDTLVEVIILLTVLGTEAFAFWAQTMLHL